MSSAYSPGLWLSILAIGAITFMYRLSFVALFANRDVPPGLRRALRFVPIAALTAIITPELLIQSGAQMPALNPRLIAGLVAAVVAYRSRNILVTIVVGMLTLWALRAIVGT